MEQEQQDRRQRYAEFVIRHEGLIFNLCLRHCGGRRDECADLVQEVALMLWRNFDRLDSGSHPRQETRWVQWKVRTFLFNYSRHSRSSHIILTDDLECAVAPDSGREMLLDLASRLDPDDRYLLLLRLDGYSNPEIADILGLSANTVSQRYRRMVNKLKKIYQNEVRS